MNVIVAVTPPAIIRATANKIKRSNVVRMVPSMAACSASASVAIMNMNTMPFLLRQV